MTRRPQSLCVSLLPLSFDVFPSFTANNELDNIESTL